MNFALAFLAPPNSSGVAVDIKHYQLTPLSLSTSGGFVAQIVTLTADNFSEYEDYDIPGWDGDDAVPISRSTVDAARLLNSLLPRGPSPDIAPGARGTIGLEWRRGLPDVSYLLVEVGPGVGVEIHSVNRHGQANSKMYASVYHAWSALSKLIPGR
jgi:hypothetical protein